MTILNNDTVYIKIKTNNSSVKIQQCHSIISHKECYKKWGTSNKKALTND